MSNTSWHWPILGAGTSLDTAQVSALQLGQIQSPPNCVRPTACFGMFALQSSSLHVLLAAVLLVLHCVPSMQDEFAVFANSS